MNHTNSTDNIRINTSSSADIHVVATYQLKGQIEQKNDYTAITSATDTNIAFADSGECRIINLSIKNAHASTSNTVKVSKYTGSTAYEMIQAVLAAGESLVFDGNGWRAFTATGKLKVEVGTGGGSSAWGGITGTLSDQTDLQSALDAKEPDITAATLGDHITAFTSKTTPVDADELVIADSAASTDAKKLTWANLKATLKSFFMGATDKAVIFNDGGEPGSDSHFTYDKTTDVLHVHGIAGDATDGLLIEADGGTDIGILGAGNTANATWYGNHNFNAVTASTIAGFGASKTLESLATATYPSLAELAYVKGVTSAIQTQINGKEPTISAGTTAQYWRGDKSWQTLNSTAVGLGNVDNTSDATKNSATATLTNKRITKRIGSTTSSATPTINTDNVDSYHLTAQTVDITSFTTNLSGTPTDGQLLLISVTGTAARAITWGASFADGAVARPTTTVTTQRLDVLYKWSSVASKWMCMASGSYADA